MAQNQMMPQYGAPMFVNPLGPKVGKGQVNLAGLPEWAPPPQLPETIAYQGHKIPLWTYQQLEELSRDNLKQRALNIVDTCGDKLPPLQKSAPHSVVSTWIIEAQVAIANAAGLPVTADHFGLPGGQQLKPSAHVLSDKERTRVYEAGYAVPSPPWAPGGAASNVPEQAAPALQEPKPEPAVPAFMKHQSTTSAHYGNPSNSPSKGENVLVGVPKRPGPPLRLG